MLAVSRSSNLRRVKHISPSHRAQPLFHPGAERQSGRSLLASPVSHATPCAQTMVFVNNDMADSDTTLNTVFISLA